MSQDKITVHTPHGDVSIGDECETESGRKVKLKAIDSEFNPPYVIEWIGTNGQKTISSVSYIRPTQKPKPLDGVELYEKFVELGLKGWSCKSTLSATVYPLISMLRILKNSLVGIDQTDPESIFIRPPRSTEWIRACDVTEETGR